MTINDDVISQLLQKTSSRSADGKLLASRDSILDGKSCLVGHNFIIYTRYLYFQTEMIIVGKIAESLKAQVRMTNLFSIMYH